MLRRIKAITFLVVALVPTQVFAQFGSSSSSSGGGSSPLQFIASGPSPLLISFIVFLLSAGIVGWRRKK